MTKKELIKVFRDLSGATLKYAREMSTEELTRRVSTLQKEAQQRETRMREAQEQREARSLRVEAARVRRSTVDGELTEEDLKWRLMVAAARNRIDEYQAHKENFTKEVLANPENAMAWSHSFFQTTGEFKVATQVLAAYLFGEDYDQYLKDVGDELARRASSLTSRSTSPTSNLMEDCYTSALAQVVKKR